jgi:hypothetical protein
LLESIGSRASTLAAADADAGARPARGRFDGSNGSMDLAALIHEVQL